MELMIKKELRILKEQDKLENYERQKRMNVAIYFEYNWKNKKSLSTHTHTHTHTRTFILNIILINRTTALTSQSKKIATTRKK